MSLHESSLKRLRESTLLEGKTLANIFETLVADAVLNEQPMLDLIVCWLEAADKFVVGTYVPELHFVVRRVEDENL